VTKILGEMMSAIRPLPTVIGPTENALRALLTKILSATQIKTYPAWVVLNAMSNVGAAASGGNWQLAVADALKIELVEIDEIVAQLRGTGLIGLDGLLTVLGSNELSKGRIAVAAATAKLMDGIGEQEQANARQVLEQVRRNAEELLQM
jgi:hypothetical protein